MRSVVICGSTRFKTEIREFAKRLKEAGVVVFEPHFRFDPEGWEKLSNDDKKYIALGLSHDHFHKIRMADVVFIYNKEGYSGNSTTLEIGFAVSTGKPIYALAADDEVCRQVFFRELVGSPEELIKKL